MDLIDYDLIGQRADEWDLSCRLRGVDPDIQPVDFCRIEPQEPQDPGRLELHSHWHRQAYQQYATGERILTDKRAVTGEYPYRDTHRSPVSGEEPVSSPLTGPHDVSETGSDTGESDSQWWETLLPRDQYPPPPPPLIQRTDGVGLIPSQGLIEVIGPRGSGKSWIACAIAAAGVLSGRPTVYFRAEGTRADLQERIETFGVEADWLLDTDRFRSVPRRNLEAFVAAQSADGLTMLSPDGSPVGDTPFTDGGVVVIDTVAAAGGTANETAVAQEWFDATIEPLRRNEATLVVLVDHTAKVISKENLTIDSRGSSVKSAESDYSLYVDGYRGRQKSLAATAWNRQRDGYFHLLVAKAHRLGHYGTDNDSNRLATVRGTHDGGRLRVAFEAPSDDEHVVELVTEARTQAVEAILTAESPLTKTKLRRAVMAACSVGQPTAEDIIDLLVVGGCIERTEGPRGHLHSWKADRQ